MPTVSTNWPEQYTKNWIVAELSFIFLSTTQPKIFCWHLQSPAKSISIGGRTYFPYGLALFIHHNNQPSRTLFVVRIKVKWFCLCSYLYMYRYLVCSVHQAAHVPTPEYVSSCINVPVTISMRCGAAIC